MDQTTLLTGFTWERRRLAGQPIINSPAGRRRSQVVASGRGFWLVCG